MERAGGDTGDDLQVLLCPVVVLVRVGSHQVDQIHQQAACGSSSVRASIDEDVALAPRPSWRHA